MREGTAAGIKEGTAIGIKEGMSLQLKRVSGILTSEEAKGRGPAALAMALESEMDMEAARKVLAALPVANSFAAEMDKLTNPKVGVQGGEVDEEKALIDGVLAFASKAGVRAHG